VAVDPYVPTRPEDAPRRSAAIPPPAGWRAVRPGDLGPAQPAGHLFGAPGPDQGYALTLAQRLNDRLELVPPETAHDALALGAEVAMKRAALFGRAPVLADVEAGLTFFGWLGGAPPDLVAWRRLATAGVAENYARRRALVDAVPEAVLRRHPGEIRDGLLRWRDRLAGAPGVTEGSADEPPPLLTG
jgi:hypothetical protein